GANESICAGSSIALGTIGINGYQYSWTPTTYLDDPTSPTPMYTYTGPITPGDLVLDTLFLETTRSSGCVSVDTVVITNSSLDAGAFVSSDYNGFGVSCPTASDGTASTQVLGGIGPFSYNWNIGGQTTPDAVGLPVGESYVTVTDNFGCEYIDTVNLEAPPALQIDAVFSDYNGFNISCTGNSDGTAEVIPSGGVGGYEFLWFDNSTDAIITGLSAGVYPVSVTDANGCIFVTNITLTEPDPLQATTLSTPAFCHPDSTGSIEISVSGGVPDYFYEGSAFGSTFEVNGLLTDTYDLTVTDLNGCPITVNDSVSLVIAEFAFPSEDASCPFGPDGSICVEITAATVGPYTYNWETGETDSCIVNYPAGLYPVTVTDGLGCIYELNPIIGSPTDLNIMVDPTPVTCNGGNDGAISIMANGGTPPYDYTWSNGGMGTVQTDLSGGTYVLTLTDGQGCVYTELIEVPEPDPFDVDFTVEDVSCNGGDDGAATVSATNGNEPFSYIWG
ncbi:MAG: SprB repeat-containing protein, partial [Bacteroidota bacterium]